MNSTIYTVVSMCYDYNWKYNENESLCPFLCNHNNNHKISEVPKARSEFRYACTAELAEKAYWSVKKFRFEKTSDSSFPEPSYREFQTEGDSTVAWIKC